MSAPAEPKTKTERTYASRHPKETEKPGDFDRVTLEEYTRDILYEHAPLLVSVDESWCDRADISACADHEQDDKQERLEIE